MPTVLPAFLACLLLCADPPRDRAAVTAEAVHGYARHAEQGYDATLSATPTRLGIYLDGELVDEGPGAPGLATDALDFLPDHAGAIGEILIYNRELSAADVARLFRASK